MRTAIIDGWKKRRLMAAFIWILVVETRLLSISSSVCVPTCVAGGWKFSLSLSGGGSSIGLSPNL